AYLYFYIILLDYYLNSLIYNNIVVSFLTILRINIKTNSFYKLISYIPYLLALIKIV
ncbi:hypothetical protein BGZ57DRAFT_778484, partial [Hyaloscypha finlandica]